MEIVEQHLEHLARLGRRAGTIYQRERVLMRLARFCAPDDAVEASLDQLRAFVQRDDFSVEYRAAQTTHLVGFYRWLVREGHRIDNPTERLERPRRMKGTPRPMSTDSLIYALTEAPWPQRHWFFLAAYAGLRAFEVAPLRGEDIESYRVLVHDDATGRNVYKKRLRLHVRDGKGGKPRAIRLHPTLEIALRPLPKRGVWFPHGWDPDRPMTGGQLDKRANRWLHEHDIPDTFHQLRHWYGTNLRAAGVDLLVVRDLMGHSSVATTEIYTRVGNLEADDAIERLPYLDDVA